MYVVPPPPKDEKLHFVVVTDPAEIEAVRQREGLYAPIGHFDSNGQCWAVRDTLTAYRESLLTAASE